MSEATSARRTSASYEQPAQDGDGFVAQPGETMSDTQDATEAPALPGDGLRQSIVDDLRRHVGEGLVEFLLKPQDDLWIRIAAEKWEATGRALRSMGFEYFCFLSAIDWKPSPFGRGEDDPTQPPPARTTEVKQGYAGGETRFQVFARVTDLKRHVGVTLKVDVDDPVDGGVLALDSWHAVYAGANWHERETHEMYGISFNGHPDLRNIYLPTEFEGYPLRKDFPLLARMVKPWPGIVDVEPMPVEDTAAAEGDVPAAPAPADGPAEGAAEVARPTSGAEASAGDVVAAAEDAPEVDAAAGADGSPTREAETEAGFVSGDVTDSGVPADTNAVSESNAASVSAEEVEAVADAAADETRAADDAAADEHADSDASDVEAVSIEPGTPAADAPIDAAATENAGPESEAAEHPEAAAEPAEATEETVADAPAHSDLDADAPPFVSPNAGESADSGDTNSGDAEAVTAAAPERSDVDETGSGVGSASEQPDASASEQSEERSDD